MNIGLIFTLVVSFAVAIGLAVAPLPEWGELLRPHMVALMLIYWCLTAPMLVGVGVAWSVGLLLDVATGSLLGQNALAMAALATLTLSFQNRIRVFPLGQQVISIILITFLALVILFWIRGSIGQSPHSATYFLPALTSGLVWPLVFALMSRVQQHRKIG